MSTMFDSAAWRAELETDREETRDYFLTQFNWRGSPVPEGFEGPRYFPVSEEWRKEAKLDRDAPGTGRRVQLQTSVGDVRDFDVYGTFVFEHDGQEQRLTAYRMVPEHPPHDELFVPFKDATTGKQTYGAGRYLDVPRHDGDDYILDFNTAYNPLCAYSPRYNCPYPPPQNSLKVAVEAGEMVPFEH
jgi:uncharacterized protein (DUF1684 family)